jgi:hypothetical protein
MVLFQLERLAISESATQVNTDSDKDIIFQDFERSRALGILTKEHNHARCHPVLSRPSEGKSCTHHSVPILSSRPKREAVLEEYIQKYKIASEEHRET